MSRKFTLCFAILVTLWGMAVPLVLHAPDSPVPREHPPASTGKSDPSLEYLNMGKCFHMPRALCPAEPDCTKVGSLSVLCCDLDNERLKEALAATMTQNTTYLHVLNATIDELDVSQDIFRRLTSMAFTDGNISKIVGKFPEYSSMACLNISNNNLTSNKLETNFPLSLVHRNRKISVDLSDNPKLPCKHFMNVIGANNASMFTILNHNSTNCTLTLNFGWFDDVQILRIETFIEYLKIGQELKEEGKGRHVPYEIIHGSR